MRIALDGISVSHPQPGGYRTYVSNLVRHLAILESIGNSFVLFVDREVTLDLPDNWMVKVVPRNLPVVGVAVREQVALPLQRWLFSAELLHSPCGTAPIVNPWPSVITLLDTLEFTLRLPAVYHTRLWAMRVYNRYCQVIAIRQAKAIITISEYSKAAICERFGVSSDRVHVTYLAPAGHLGRCTGNRENEPVRARFGLGKYILALASVSPRKNIDRLLASYERLDPLLRHGFPLAVVCSHPTVHKSLARFVDRLGIGQDVVLLQRVSDNDMALLLRDAAMFVFPSLEEGFGLPPLEAMACGTPVVSSNTSSMPEVLGDAALLVNPWDIDAMSAAMAQILTIPMLADELREKGVQRSRQFTWKQTAEKTLAVYRLVTSGNNDPQ